MKPCQFNPFRFTVLASLSFAMTLCVSQAVSLTWDGGPGASSTDDAVTGGDGTWTTGVDNWDDGLLNSLNAAWVDWYDAIFGGTAGTISLASGGVSVHNITFNSGYTIQSNTLILGGSSPTISTATGSTATISSIIDGTAGLTKAGVGYLTLSGSSSNTYSGTTTFSRGRLLLAKTGGAVAVGGDLSLAASGGWSTDGVFLSGDEQIADTAVIRFNLATTHNGFFLMGKTETVTGIDCTNGFGVIWNSYPIQSSNSTGTLILNTPLGGNYSFNGFLGDNQGDTNSKLALTKTGSGVQTLTGGYINYSGLTTVNGGTLVLQDTTAFGSTSTVGSDGTLVLNRTVNGAANVRVSALITGSGVINVNNSTSGIAGGWVSFNSASSGLNNFTGTINVNSGVLSMNNGLGAWSGNPTMNVVSGGLFGIRAQNISIDALNGDGDVGNFHNSNKTLTIGAADGSGSFSGIIHGNNTTSGTDYSLECGIVNVTKSGSGTQTLTGTNTYTGSTTINNGTLQLGDGTSGKDGSLTTSGISVGSAGTLTYNLYGDQTVSYAISGAQNATLVKAGGGTLTLDNTGAVGFGNDGSTLKVTGGTLKYINLANNTGLYQKTINISSGAVLEMNAASGINNLLGAWNHTYDGAGTLRKSGDGSLVMGGYGGTVAVNFGAGALIDVTGGTLNSGGGGGIPDWTENKASLAVAAGAIFDLFGSTVLVNALTGYGTVKNSSGSKILTVGVDGGGGSFGGSLVNGAGTLGLTKTGGGTQTLSGTNNSYTGATTINGGTLVVNGSLASASAVTVSNGGNLGGNGSVGGATSIKAGGIHSAATALGTAADVQKFTGNLTYEDASIFSWEIAKTNAGGQTRGIDYDAVNVTGTLAGLDGADGNSTTDAFFRIVIGDSDFSDAFWNTDRSWGDIFTAADGSTDKANWASIFGGGNFQYYKTDGTQLSTPTVEGSFSFVDSGTSLKWTAVPEPSSALAGLLLGSGLLRRRRAGRSRES